METLRGMLALLAALTAVSNGVLAQDASALASSYVEAQELGRRDEKDPLTVEYHRSVLLPDFGARYRAHLRDCQATLPQPDQTPFSFVAALDSEGKVLRLWSDRTPTVYSCVRGKLLFERFPPPPRAPFYLYVHMRFVVS
ncbi:MAG TPA: hypothetical protein VES91_09115 [Burkholderiaceae bacterium]|nr:hypothetical protein [Burkholderiaceae bacterium]